MPQRILLAFLGLAWAFFAAVSKGETPRTAPISLPEVWPPHPRLIATQADWDQLAVRRAADKDLDAFVLRLVAEARTTLTEPAIEHRKTGRRLLGVSREFIRRVLLCSLAYRVTGEQVFLEQARADMLTVSGFDDWNPSHFLDVGEMSAGLALGYDWLYPQLGAADRAVIRQALVSKSLAPCRGGHSTFSLAHNWSQVCGGGIAVGALAVADEEPALAAEVLTSVHDTLHWGLDPYAPDGAYPEGPSYWTYGTQYSTLLAACLRSSLGGDWGILGWPGFLDGARFYTSMQGPSGEQFDYADSDGKEELAPPLFYIAQQLRQPSLAEHQKRRFVDRGRFQRERFAPLIAFWWPFDDGAPARAQPLWYRGRGKNPVVAWRGSWNERDTLYFAIKGGGAGVNHGHMDGGSFVMDLDGVRWASDLGMQDYESLESKGVDLWNTSQRSQRWTIFRLGADSHNVLTIDGHPHNAKGLARLVEADAHGAIIDLSPVFLPGEVRAAVRQVKLGDRDVEIIDTVEGARPGSMVRWAMTTGATITPAGAGAVLERDGKRLQFQAAGAGVAISAVDVSTPSQSYDAPNPGMRQVIVTAPVKADGTWRLSVRLGGLPAAGIGSDSPAGR